MAWREQIRAYLADHLLLALNDGRERIRPVSDGVDFLGYVVRPSHRLVRRRVVGHCTEKLKSFERLLVQREPGLITYQYPPQALEALQACLASYLGHFRRAAARRLCDRLWRRFGWLQEYFVFEVVHQPLRRRDAAPRQGLGRFAYYRWWCQAFPNDEVWIEHGHFAERWCWPPRSGSFQGGKPGFAMRPAEAPAMLNRMRPNRRGAQFGFPVAQVHERLRDRARARSGGCVSWLAGPSEHAGLPSPQLAWRIRPAAKAR